MRNSYGLLVTLLFACPLMSVANVGPPVYLFRDARVKSSLPKPLAGHTIPTNDFTKLLADIKESDLMITFLQDELSNEDFLRLDQNMKRGGLFKNVQKYSEMKTATYFPAVKVPAHSLASLSGRYNEQVELKDSEQVVKYLTNTKPEKDTAILIHLAPTNGEDSSLAIRKNDELIGEVMSLIEQSGLTYIAFFTGQKHRKAHEVAVVQGVGRHLLQTVAVESENNTVFFFNNNSKCLMYIDSMEIVGKLIKEVPQLSCEVDNSTTVTTLTLTSKTDATTKFKVVMNFTKDARQLWKLNSTTVDEKAVVVPEVSAPLKFCYHCSVGVTFSEVNDTATTTKLYFKTLQVQVFDFEEYDKFGYSYDCVGFFTIPLWTGLLTSLFLVAVMVYGLYMLSSIQTFDQYDDPKGKPLTVTISE